VIDLLDNKDSTEGDVALAERVAESVLKNAPLIDACIDSLSPGTDHGAVVSSTSFVGDSGVESFVNGCVIPVSRPNRIAAFFDEKGNTIDDDALVATNESSHNPMTKTCKLAVETRQARRAQPNPVSKSALVDAHGSGFDLHPAVGSQHEQRPKKMPRLWFPAAQTEPSTFGKMTPKERNNACIASAMSLELLVLESLLLELLSLVLVSLILGPFHDVQAQLFELLFGAQVKLDLAALAQKGGEKEHHKHGHHQLKDVNIEPAPRPHHCGESRKKRHHGRSIWSNKQRSRCAKRKNGRASHQNALLICRLADCKKTSPKQSLAK